MDPLDIIVNSEKFLTAVVGSARYGYASMESDRDMFFLTRDTDVAYHDADGNATYFAWSIQHLKDRLGHPMLLGNLTADCTGDERLCTFLRSHKREISYVAPSQTALQGLSYIAAKEGIQIDTAVRPPLITAFVLSHMAAEADDPFLFSDEEKSILIRTRTGGVLPAERADIYRRTISPENIDRLMKMPDNLTIKSELFALLKEVTSC